MANVPKLPEGPRWLHVAFAIFVAGIAGLLMYESAREEAREAQTPFDLAQLHPDVRAAAERARDAERRAHAIAALAREAAERARAGGVCPPADGLGVIGYGSDGEQFAGYVENGKPNGLGVYTYRRNAENKSLRYEGEYLDGARSGVGVHIWRGGNQYAGSFQDGPAVYTYANGGRNEGDMINGKRSGHAVAWDERGRAVEAGIWAQDKLLTPLGPEVR